MKRSRSNGLREQLRALLFDWRQTQPSTSPYELTKPEMADIMVERSAGRYSPSDSKIVARSLAKHVKALIEAGELVEVRQCAGSMPALYRVSQNE